jgi:modulator of FtsH protease
MNPLEDTLRKAQLGTSPTSDNPRTSVNDSEISKVLRNTYLLLSMTLLWSAVTAAGSIAIGLGHGTGLVLSLIGFGLLFWVQRAADTSKGILAIFAFTGCMGASIGPMLSFYLALPSGPGLILQALAGTAIVFFTLSGYVLTTRKDFSFLGGFLFTGLILVVIAALVNIFLNVPILSLALPALIVIIMSGLILFDTSRIIHGGETNYIRATVSLYLNILNLFTALLRLLGAFSDD